MSKYILNHEELKLNPSTLEFEHKTDIKEMKFSSAVKRSSFMADKIIGSVPTRVFMLIVEYNKGSNDVYIFDKWSCVNKIAHARWEKFYLFEYESYKHAYRDASDFPRNQSFMLK